ncbi:hypothetical protein [Acanthamoeba castellanii mimivirus]|uniref:Uncharacterized protein n=3 Tax=Mimivirus TaxID=315393 RepID=E3VXQ0_MIMIV|nr:hypothetical protein MIMI_gp0037 [Acanthamoeba polyphaga mimivirus]AHA45857.1 hypothetical protein HIRU_S951 [Hirudovirus strain Sangsue]AMK61719.1 hypothetical protein [Samba virus]BAV61106.1 hypothetical protein [Acanthamoeba castellanii mimivirus]ADO18148.1 hypothetical protein [Acanthamoeba polyphaga mimivirus]AKI80676.1 hypothetical protein [Acanthamoeba polyphaga mimivirus]
MPHKAPKSKSSQTRYVKDSDDYVQAIKLIKEINNESYKLKKRSKKLKKEIRESRKELKIMNSKLDLIF